MVCSDPAARRFAPLGEPRAHFWLVQRMARATGIDLVHAMKEGHLTQADWAATVTRCRGCAWTEGCDRWLDQRTEAPRPCPSTCENQSIFQSLQSALTAQAPLDKDK